MMVLSPIISLNDKVATLHDLTMIYDGNYMVYSVIIKVTHHIVITFSFSPDAVALVDAYGIFDETLNSTLGSYDGNAYDRLYDAAKRCSVNKTQVRYISATQALGYIY